MCLFHSLMVGFLLSVLATTSVARAGREPSYVRRNRETIESIYDLVVFPNNVPIAQGLSAAVPDNLFNDDVTGRVTPLGAFSGLNDSLEYFFAISIPIPPNYSGFSKADVVQFSSECPEVAASTVYLETSLFIPNRTQPAVSTLKEVAFWNFDENGAVLFFDAWIPNLSEWISVTRGGIDIYSPEVQQGTIAGICQTSAARCTGPNQQYESFEDCVQTLSGKTYGNYDNVWGDNVVCRSIHTLLTATRPDVHCAHIGPSGGGKCIDIPYADKYINDEAIFGSPSAEIFKCPPKHRRNESRSYGST